jgi:beta-galactosidase
MLVDVEGASDADGARIIQWSANGGTNQQWRLTPVDSGYVKIVSVHTGKLIGVAGDSTGDSAVLVQQSDTGSTSQHWSVTPL